MADAPAGQAATSLDLFLGGRLALRQRKTGHRAGTDAVLLAAAAGEPRGLVMDAGAGAGAAGLALALRAPACFVRCIEINPAAAALARENIADNALAQRADCVEADILQAESRRAAGLVEASAALVISNPPFLDPARSRLSPDAARALAHAAPPDRAGEEPFLARWLRACAALLSPGGRVVIIHRADALDLLLAAMKGRFGGLRLLPVLPRADAPAIRILASAVKGSRAPLCVLPPLVLHGPDGRFTEQAEAIHRGEILIAL